MLFSSLGRSIQGFDAGEVLLSEFNCVACHQAGTATQQRLASKQAPRLGANGLRLTPQYLRAYLTNPHGEGPGRTMPDLLHGMAAAEKSETVEALVHFLASLMSAETNDAIGADQFKIQQGRLLFHRVGCVACHAPHETVATIAAKPGSTEGGALSNSNEGLTDFKLNSIPLVNLARKTTVAELAKFLLDPLKARPSGRMPSLNLTESEATAIAMYLLREQALGISNPSLPREKLKGLRYEYFEEAFNEGAPDFASFTPKATGVIERFTLAPLKRNERAGLRFTGFVTVPADGDYTFYTASDDGSRLYLGDQLVVNNDGLHAMDEQTGIIRLKAGDHPITVTWFNGDAQLDLRVSWKGPGLNKQEIPASVLTHIGQPMVPLGEEKFTVDAAKANRGRELFGRLGCAACHEVSGEKISSALATKNFSELTPAQGDGCLGENVRAGVPQYFLTRPEREALRATLTAREKLAQPLAPKEQVTRTLAVMNCFACHARDGLGGPMPGRVDHFSIVGEADLGEEGRLPPHLTRVGDKLRPEWLREVLLNKGAARPYMATRMPQFGEANVGHLPAAFAQADSAGQADTPLEYSARDVKQGRKLVGTGGMACISCHVFAGHKSLGIPALDMATMTKRLKRDWFRRYLIDPASLRPGTRMPTFWPEGKSARPEILEGNSAKQID
ncbi:MAG: cytochrome c1, partial [Verrucomicrobia bacterium]|nr:cytochrome c1 [Verrucomicrobiota bacterium]